MKLFSPEYEICGECRVTVLKNMPQDIMIDKDGKCWRLCISCKAKEQTRKAA